MNRLSLISFALLIALSAFCSIGCVNMASSLSEEVGEFEIASYGQADGQNVEPASRSPHPAEAASSMVASGAIPPLSAPYPTVVTEPVAAPTPLERAQAQLVAHSVHAPAAPATTKYTPAPAPRLPENVVVATESSSEQNVTIKARAPKNFVVRTTAYTHLEEDSLPYGTKTARGDELKFGQLRSAAADWSRYPVGTRFKIKGLPYEYIVDDYGSALVGTDTIDLYKPDHSMMNDWGARHVGIEVIEWGSFRHSHEIISGRVNLGDFPHLRVMLREIEQKLRIIPPELQDGFDV